MSAPQYTFEKRDYIEFMPVITTDQFSHRLHLCPICGAKQWSVFAHADKHWQGHAQPEKIELTKKRLGDCRKGAGLAPAPERRQDDE